MWAPEAGIRFGSGGRGSAVGGQQERKHEGAKEKEKGRWSPSKGIKFN